METTDFVALIEQPTWKSVLISTIKSVKMDLWDVDISFLAEKYLEKINSMEKYNLRIPANAILCSAILLKYKAKTIKLPIDMEDDEDELAIQEAENKEARKLEKLFLTEGMPELASPRLMREGKVSFDELVSSIESIINQTKRKKLRNLNRNISFHIPWSEKNIEEKKDSVLKKVKEMIDEEGLVLFSSLIKGKTPLETIHFFLPLLFLHNEGEINLFQETFFGEIFISLATKDKIETSESSSKEIKKVTEIN